MPKTNMSVVLHILALITVTVLALAVSFALVGCGHDNKVSNEDEQLRRLQAQLAQQMADTADLQLEYAAVVAAVGTLSSNIASLTAAIELATAQNATQDADLAVLHSLLDSANVTLISLQAQITQLQGSEMVMQTTINGLILQIAALQGMNNIVGIIDPCGDSPGRVDEVLLQLSGGRVLASFSDNAAGQNTRFSIIPSGNFMTTDGSNCVFSVNDGVVSW